MNFRVKLVLQLFVSLLLSYIALTVTYSSIKDVNSKFIFKGVVKVTDYPINSRVMNISSLKNKISVFFSEAQEEIIYGDLKHKNCNKLDPGFEPIRVRQNKAGYFVIELISVENEIDLIQCFEEFLLFVDNKFKNEIEKLEENLIYKESKPEIIEQFFKEENFPNIEGANEEAKLFLFQQRTSYLLQERLENLEFNNYINTLKSEGPTRVLRTTLQKQTLDKRNYFVVLFFGIFSIIFLIFNHKDLGYSRFFEKLTKLLEIKKS